MNEIICGDCREVMAGMPANSIDAIVTDPPYGLEFMGKEWDRLWAKRDGKRLNLPGRMTGTHPYLQAHVDQYIGGSQAQQWHATWAKEALRIAKPGCHLLAFGGTRTFHRLTCAIEDAGWEIRDCLMFVYGSGFPKSHNLTGDWEGWGTALKPAWEPIILARKPVEGTVAENVQKWGTGAINIDGCRIGAETRLNPEAGFIRRGRTDEEVFGCVDVNKPNNPPHAVKGRWPANLIHDGSKEVVAGFPESKDGIAVKHQGVSSNGVTGWGACPPGTPDIGYGGQGSAARFFYCAKSSRSERNCGGTVVNIHPTCKPLALMRYLCRLVTPPNGLILDPFAGSGTTGMAANYEGFQFIGIDNNFEYCQIAKKRIVATIRQEPLFA